MTPEEGSSLSGGDSPLLGSAEGHVDRKHMLPGEGAPHCAAALARPGDVETRIASMAFGDSRGGLSMARVASGFCGDTPHFEVVCCFWGGSFLCGLIL